MKIDLLLIPMGARYPEMRAAARAAEEAGYDGVWTWDHLRDPDEAAEAGDQPERKPQYRERGTERQAGWGVDGPGPQSVLLPQPAVECLQLDGESQEPLRRPEQTRALARGREARREGRVDRPWIVREQVACVQRIDEVDHPAEGEGVVAREIGQHEIAEGVLTDHHVE